MDPELLKSHEAFKKRASTTTSKDADAKKSRLTEKDTSDAVKLAKSRRDNQKYKMKEAEKAMRAQAKQQQQLADAAVFDYKTVKAAPSTDLGTLAKVVNYMKTRHLNGQTYSLTIDEVLLQCMIFDISRKTKQWLMETLPRNPVLEFDEAAGKFHYRPPYPIKNRATLLTLLKRYDMENSGGILVSEVAACVGNADKLIEGLGASVIKIACQVSKKKDLALFYNDSDTEVAIDQEFKELWRSVNIEHLEERKIDEYLAKHGIHTMLGLAPKKQINTLKRRTRKTAKQVQNEHMAGTLQDYSIQ